MTERDEIRERLEKAVANYGLTDSLETLSKLADGTVASHILNAHKPYSPTENVPASFRLRDNPTLGLKIANDFDVLFGRNVREAVIRRIYGEKTDPNSILVDIGGYRWLRIS